MGGWWHGPPIVPTRERMRPCPQHREAYSFSLYSHLSTKEVSGGNVAKSTHARLTEGSYRYHAQGAGECPECLRPPAVKIMLDDDDEVRGIRRTFFCGEATVDFSIGVQAWAGPRKAFVDVVRACSSHANYHVHWWHHLRVSETSVEEKYPLNAQEDVNRAYMDASVNIFPRYEEWRNKWAAKR